MPSIQSKTPSTLKAIEDELNSYPIKGFRFKVSQMDIERDYNMFSSAYSGTRIKMEIWAEYDFKNPADPVEVLTWFYLALDNYAKKSYDSNLEIKYESSNGKTSTRAFLSLTT